MSARCRTAVRLAGALSLAGLLILISADRAAAPPTIVRGVTSFDGTRIYVDDEPFFPFGIYWFDAEDLPEYQKYRINVVYAQTSTSQFNAAANAGSFVIAAGRNEEQMQSFSANPRLLAWFLMDDADTEEEARVCRERKARIRQIDTRRPLFASINGRDPEIDARFRDIVDIYCPYRYALPRFTYGEYAAWFDSLRAGFGVETLWTTIQSSHIYSKHRELGFTDLELAIALEPAQLRLLVWTVISHGARGVLMWPENGLFDGREWTRDRRAEVGILGSEIEVLAPLLIEGTERRGGARTSRADVDVCRIDRGDASLLLLMKTGRTYHLAVDDGVARDVEVRVLGAAGSRAWAVSFPEPRSLTARNDGEDLVVSLDSVELTEFVVVTRDESVLGPIAERMAGHLPDVARFAEESTEVFGAKVGDVLTHLGRLGALPPGLPAPPDLAEAVGTRTPSMRYLAARDRARRFRDLAARCRTYADDFVGFVAADASMHRMTVFTLPQYFSSFDVAAARRHLAGSSR